MTRPWIELDSDALRANLLALRGVVSSGCEVMVSLAGNATGHGLLPVAQCAWAAGIKTFVTDRLDQSEALRRALPLARIVLDGFVEPGDAPNLIEWNVHLVVFDEAQALDLARRAMHGLKALSCHAMVDTGLGAVGLPWRQAGVSIPKLARTSGLKIVGLCSRFASSAKEDRTFADVQAARFRQVEKACRDAGVANLFRHMSDSGGLLRRAEWDLDGVRVGTLAYGYDAGAAGVERPVRCRPVLSWRTRLVQVVAAPCDTPVGYGSTHITRADTCLGTFAAGTADGYRSAFGNRAHVLCGGRRAPVVGRVALRWGCVDLGPRATARPGDEVTLIGQDGDAAVGADELADLCGVPVQEILCGIHAPVRTQKGAQR